MTTLIILSVDDLMFMRSMLRNMLRELGHDSFVEASDGTQAILFHKLLKPDITFLDITMPDMNGLECLQQIKSMDDDANIIMCSVVGQKSFMDEAYTLGVRDFIVKPFDSHRPMEAISNVIILFHHFS